MKSEEVSREAHLLLLTIKFPIMIIRRFVCKVNAKNRKHQKH